jgi:predicted ATP-grasp superfamily ATP-dependent carboligase
MQNTHLLIRSRRDDIPKIFITFSKDVRLPVQLQRAMAAEAEATREARAKVIAAEGEHKASRALRDAAEVIGDSPAALQLRYLQVKILVLHC